MISRCNVQKYCCEDISKIENYTEAVTDTTQMWDCHHRFEAIFSKEELIKHNWYFDVEPNCLIFLTRAEHNRLHKSYNQYTLGKKLSEEAKRKISEARKGRPSNNRKKVLCVETDETFESACEASRKTGVNNGNISSACNGKLDKAGGFHWKFV